MTTTDPAPDSGTYELRIERTVDATPDALFDAFLALYEPPHPDWIIESRLDLRVGGNWTVVFEPPGVGRFREDRVLSTVDRPHQIAYRVVRTAQGERRMETTFRLTFDEVATGTRVTLAQHGFPDLPTRDDYAAAWQDVLDALTTNAVRQAPGDV